MTLFDEPPRSETASEQDDHRVRVKLIVAYDGSGFHGFAANHGVTTVAGTLEQALETVTQSRVSLTAAGRTDRGVHAWGQVVSVDLPADVNLSEMQHAVNRICRGSIVVRDASVADHEFDARFSASSRVYRYTIVNRPAPDPLVASTAWWVEQPLDVRSMQLACDPLIGEHDFSTFCRRPKSAAGDEHSLVRRVIDAQWTVSESERTALLRFQIEAKAFCQQMVRSIVGTMVDVGSGRKRAGEVAAILRAGNRSLAGHIAPPHGLCLWEVHY